MKNIKKANNQLKKRAKNKRKFLEEEKMLVDIINPQLFIMLYSLFLLYLEYSVDKTVKLPQVINGKLDR